MDATYFLPPCTAARQRDDRIIKLRFGKRR